MRGKINPKKILKPFVGAFAVMAIVMMVSPVVSAGTWQKPYSAATPIAEITANTRSGTGQTKVYTSPYTAMDYGNVYMDGACIAGIAGYATLDMRAGFKGFGFTATKAVYTVTYTWKVVYSYTLTAFMSPWGGSAAQASCYVYGNLYDQSSGAWMLNGDKGTCVYLQKITGPLSGTWKATVTKTVTFTLVLVPGHTYTFFTYVKTHANVQAVGGATATSRTDLAGGEYANLQSIVTS